MEFNVADSLKFADAYYSGIQIVSQYMQRQSGMIEAVFVKPETGHRDASIKLLWFRARGWMHSLEALNHAKHFQAISTATRALLEITTDLVLLHHGQDQRDGWKVLSVGHFRTNESGSASSRVLSEEEPAGAR